MRRTISRRFTLMDAMVLIAATGIGIAVGRWYCLRAAKADHNALPPPLGILIPCLKLDDVIRSVEPILFFLMWSVLLLKFRKPRPTVRQMAGQVGFASLLVVVPPTALMVPLALVAIFIKPARNFFPSFWVLWYMEVNGLFSIMVAPSILAVWLVMALRRSFRIEPGWIGWTTVFFSAAWLAVFVASNVVPEIIAYLTP